MNGGNMTFVLIDTDGEQVRLECDSVSLVAADGADCTGGGSMGIRRGHTPAIVALGEGIIRVSLGGKTLYEAPLNGGLASVFEDNVTVVTEKQNKGV